MRLLDRYILTRVIVGTIFGIFCLSAVLLLGQLFKEIKPLIEDQQAPLLKIIQFLWSSVPFMLTFTLPWAFLSAVVLAFGKLSSSNELISIRMAGWGLGRIALPIAVMGALLSGFSLWLNGTIAPQAKNDIQTLLLEAVKENPQSFLKPGTVQKRLGDESRLYVEGREGKTLKGFHFYQLVKGKDFPVSYVYAEEVGVTVTKDQQNLSLDLRDAYIENREESSPILIADQAQPWIIKIPNNQKGKKLGSMTNREIREDLTTNASKHDKRSILKREKEISKRQSIAMACFCLGLIGVPLGINSSRKESNSGFIVALLIAALYYGLLMGLEGVGDTVAMRRFMIWLPNILCFACAMFFYRKATFS